MFDSRWEQEEKLSELFRQFFVSVKKDVSHETSFLLDEMEKDIHYIYAYKTHKYIYHLRGIRYFYYIYPAKSEYLFKKYAIFLFTNL